MARSQSRGARCRHGHLHRERDLPIAPRLISGGPHGRQAMPHVHVRAGALLRPLAVACEMLDLADAVLEDAPVPVVWIPHHCKGEGLLHLSWILPAEGVQRLVKVRPRTRVLAVHEEQVGRQIPVQRSRAQLVFDAGPVYPILVVITYN